MKSQTASTARIPPGERRHVGEADQHPTLAAKHAAWHSHPLSDLAFAVHGRLNALAELVRSVDVSLNVLGRVLQDDSSAARYIDHYGYTFSVENEDHVNRVLMNTTSFIAQARACFENLADFYADFLKHYLDQPSGDKRVRYAKLEALVTDPSWIAALRDARHDLLHTRYPWLAFEVTGRFPLRYDPVLLFNWRPKTYGPDNIMSFQKLRDIRIGLANAVEAVVRDLLARIP